jgi:hypothetical protein
MAKKIDDFIKKAPFPIKREMISERSILSGLSSSPKKPAAGRSKKFSWTLGIFIFLFLFFATSAFFSRAEVVITPLSESYNLANTFKAVKNAPEGELSFEVMSLSGEESVTLQATGSKDVVAKSRGVAVIYNNYNKSSQKLVKNTRLESPDGKIYRIDNEVVVPGMKTGNGESIPGSVEVTFQADQPGPEYNGPPTDFSIPGFKGDPRYGKFYARSKGEITGGFSGKMSIVDEAEKEKAAAELSSKIREKLLAEARLELPSNYILFSNAASLKFSDTGEAGEPVDGQATFKMTGRLDAVIFDEKELTSQIAEGLIEEYGGEAIIIPELAALEFIPLSSGDTQSLNEFSFSLKGEATMVYGYDENLLKSGLAGQKKKQASAILSQYEKIEKADIILRPFWKSKFPNDPSKIILKNTKLKS